MEHDLDRHVSYLRAALQQDRRPLALFLGAGAPLAVRSGGKPIIPAIDGLTTMVTTAVPVEDQSIVNQCLSELVEPGRPRPTIEHLLDYLRRLSAIPGADPVRGLAHEDVERADASVCTAIRGTLSVELPSNGTPYHDVALWSRAALRHAPLEVFTTNYDLLLEQAMETNSVPYFDGFVGSHRPSFDVHAVEEDKLPSRWVRLWKLHGSINWSMSADGLVRRCFATDTSERTLIYPSHLKYDQSRRLPYLALLDRLRAFLRLPGAVMISCGFAFRDAHINDIITQSLHANPTAALLALQFETLSTYATATSMASTTPNLSLMAKDAAVIGSQLAPWEGASEFSYGDFGKLGALVLEVVGANPSAPAPIPTTPV